MKIVRGFVFIGILVIWMMRDEALDAGDYEFKIVNYVALGDSIAKGYGLEDVEKESYVGQICSALEERYGAVRVTNFGQNGQRSEQLLDILVNEENENHFRYIQKIQHADIITLSIGSNDLLQYVSLGMDLSELEKRGGEIFTNACLRFQDNIPQIIDRIQEEAPKAQLFINNIYNPCNDVSFQFSDEIVKNLDELAETYINQINTGFQQDRVQEVFSNTNASCAREQYVLIDVKNAFDKSHSKLINMAFAWGEVDPHPNAEGHRKIAELIIPRISLNK